MYSIDPTEKQNHVSGFGSCLKTYECHDYVQKTNGTNHVGN